MEQNLDFLNPHEQKIPDSPKGYYCPDCEQYFDEHWSEINRFDAVDRYDIEIEPCYYCEEIRKDDDLFETIGKSIMPC